MDHDCYIHMCVGGSVTSPSDTYVYILYTCIYMGGRVKWENVTVITIRTIMEVPLLTLTNGVAVYLTTMIHVHILRRKRCKRINVDYCLCVQNQNL